MKSSEVKCMTKQEGKDETAPEKSGTDPHLLPMCYKDWDGTLRTGTINNAPDEARGRQENRPAPERGINL